MCIYVLQLFNHKFNQLEFKKRNFICQKHINIYFKMFLNILKKSQFYLICLNTLLYNQHSDMTEYIVHKVFSAFFVILLSYLLIFSHNLFLLSIFIFRTYNMSCMEQVYFLFICARLSNFLFMFVYYPHTNGIR